MAKSMNNAENLAALQVHENNTGLLVHVNFGYEAKTTNYILMEASSAVLETQILMM